MEALRHNFGVIDNRFLARSIGLLNPPTPLLVHEDETVRAAVEKLKQHKIGSVIVTDLAGKLVGIFSERDVVLKLCLTDIDLNKTHISELMTKAPQTANMTTTIAFALNMMSQGGYRHIPIVDDDNFPVGIISVKNIVDFISHSLTHELVNFGTD